MRLHTLLTLTTAMMWGVANLPAQDEPAETTDTQEAMTAPEPSDAQPREEVRSDRKSAPHVILMYLPNRFFDILDMVRLRARVGPGGSVAVRLTKPLSASIGGHFTVFAGLPGPRKRPQIPLPVGLEQDMGLQMSILDWTVNDRETRHIPSYGFWEVGAGVQLLLVGAEVGVDAFEVLDFAAGLLAIDPVGDDL